VTYVCHTDRSHATGLGTADEAEAETEAV
jgi:hypothetical protein